MSRCYSAIFDDILDHLADLNEVCYNELNNLVIEEKYDFDESIVCFKLNKIYLLLKELCMINNVKLDLEKYKVDGEHLYLQTHYCNFINIIREQQYDTKLDLDKIIETFVFLVKGFNVGATCVS